MKPRIIVEICTISPEIRNYGITAILATSKGDMFKFPLNRIDGKSLKKIGQIGRDVLDSLDSLSGLKACWIENHELIIHKASAFYWRDIENGIVNALRIVFGKDAEEEEVKKPKKRYCRCQSKENPRTCFMASGIHEEIEAIS